MADDRITIVIEGDDKASGVFDRIGGALKGLGAAGLAVAGGAVVGLTAALGSSVQVAGEFETKMNLLQAVSGATADEMAQIGQKAIALGADLTLPATSASQAGEAMLELTKSGFSVQQAMDAAKGTLQLAAAAGIAEARAAEIASNAINAFGLSASDATLVADLLAASANASSIEIGDVADSYQMASAVFAGFQGPVVGAKESLVDLTTAIALLGNVGIKGSDAGTALKQSLLQLAGPSAVAKDQMRALYLATMAEGDAGQNLNKVLQGNAKARTEGLQGLLESAGATAQAGDIAYDAAGKMRPFEEILRLTAQATRSMSDEMRNDAITTIFGADAARAIIPLMKMEGEEWDKMATAIQRKNAAAELAAARTKGWQGAVAGLQSQMETFQLLLGTAVLPVITSLITDHIAPAASSFVTFAQGILSSSDPLLAFAQSLTNVSPGLSAIAFYLIDLIRHGQDLGGWLATTPASFQFLVGAIQTIGQALSALLSGDLATFAATIGPLLLQIGQIVLQNALAWGQQLIDWVLPALPPLLAALGQFLSQAWSWVQAQAPGWLAQLLSWGQALVNWVSPYIPPALSALTSLLAQAWAWVQQQAPGWLAQLLSWGQQLAAWVAPYIPPLLSALGGLIAEGWAWVVSQAPGWGQQLLSWGQQLVSWVAPQIPPLLGALGGLASSFLGWVGEQAQPLLSKLGDWANAFVAWIPGATVKFLAEWPTTLRSFLNWIEGAAGPILSQLGSWAVAFVAWIVPNIPNILLALAGIALALGVFIIETAVVLAGKLGEWAKALYMWVQNDLMPVLPHRLEDIQAAIGNWIIKAAGWLLGEAGKLGKSLLDGIKSGISQAWSSFENWIGDQVAKIPDPIRKALRIGSPSKVMADLVGLPIVQGIAQGIGDGLPVITDAMLDVASRMIDVVSKGVDAFGKLRNLGTVPESAVRTFTDSLILTLNLFSSAAESWGSAAVSAASQLTAKAMEVVSFLSAGVDALAKLADLGDIPEQAIPTFVSAITSLMVQLAEATTIQMRIGMVAAVEFAKLAGEVVKVIGAGVDGLSKLKDFAPPTQDAIWSFTSALADIVYAFAVWASRFQSDWLASASSFADGAGNVVAVLGDGVAGIAQLADFVAPAVSAVWSFTNSLADTIYAFVVWSQQFPAEWLAAAGQFADGAGKVVGVIKTAVEGLSALTSFEAPSYNAMQNFANAVHAVVNLMVGIAQYFTSEGLSAASAFADTAGRVLGLIKSGVEGLMSLAGFESPAYTAVLNFSNAVHTVVVTLGGIGNYFTAEALDAATRFANAANTVLGLIKTAIESFTKLAEFQGVAPGLVSTFAASLTQLVSEFQRIAVPEATRLGDIVMNSIVAGAQAAGPNLTTATMNAVIAAYNQVVAAIPLFVSLGDQLMNGMTQGIINATGTMVSAVVRAMQAAITAAQQTLGIASPSRVFEDQIGEQIGAGTAKGVTGSIPLVSGAVGSLSTAAVGAGSTTTNTSSVHIGTLQIVQQPGEDGLALAHKAIDEIARLTGMRLA